MKNFKLVTTLALLFILQNAHAAWDNYKAGVGFSYGGYHKISGAAIATELNNAYLGRYSSGGSLTMDYAQFWTYKNGGGNACAPTLFYRVYRTCDAPGAFTPLTLSFLCEFGNAGCQDVSNTGDQMWQATSGANLITGLTSAGTYIVEVYYEYTGAETTAGCGTTKFLNNGGANYKAYFEYEVNDSFTDGASTSSPTWTGDTGNFIVVNNSRCSGLLGTESTRTQTLQLNVASGAGTQSIASQIATWDAQQEWYFWMGRNDLSGGINYSGVNQQTFWLYANESNLESATVDGYRLIMGEDVTTHLRLQRINDGVATTIFTSSTGISNGLVDFGVAFKITRTQDGVWTLYSSTLPTTSIATQSSATPLSCPETSATINHGTVTDNTIVPAASGYIGLQAMHSSGAAARVAAEFDNIRFRALPPSTYFAIQGPTTGTLSEDAALASNGMIEVAIYNPSNSVASTVDLVLTSGDAGRIGRGTAASTAYAPSYTTITLTWAANDNTSKFVYIDPDNNDLCDDMASLNFQLQNATGGNNAYVGAPDTYVLTLVDDNMGYDMLLNADFETGGTTGWITTGTAWNADNDAPINGTNSLHHSTQSTNGTSSIVYDLDDVCLPGATTTWRFNLKFQDDCSANNNFQVFLAANESDLFSSTVDGYAVVIDQTAAPTSGTDEFIRLYRVTNNAYSSLIIGSTYEWLNNLNGGTKVGIEVVLADNGTWTLRVDPDGDFDGLVSAGTGTDATYAEIKYFGTRFKYTASQATKLRMDDIQVSQKGCRQIWYSQTSGAPSASNVWSKQVVGATQPAYPGRYSRFVIQNGHNITNAGMWICQDITINSGGTITEGSSNMKVFGNWINNGTYTAGTGTVTFKGNLNQALLGSQATTFNNLKIDNDGSTVTCVADVIAHGVVTPQEGNLDANGKLTIFSNGSVTGSIGTISNAASVINNINLIRHIPSIPFPYGAYVNLGCPLQSQTAAAWNDDIITTGFAGSDYPSSSFNNIRLYNEATVGSSNNGYEGIANVSTALENDRGYFVWMQGAVQTIDLFGQIRTGNITQNLSYTTTAGGGLLNDGWNLMTNPYPSEVDWNLVSANLTGPKVYYVYDRNTSSYKFRNAANNTGSASRYIPHSQSFLVKVNAAGQSLSYQETFKTATGTAFERSENEQTFFAIQLSKEDRADEVIVSLMDEATPDFDLYDVQHLSSPDAEAVQMALLQNAELPLSMDSRPYNQNLSIPVHVKMPTAGTYTLTILEDQNLPLGACLILEDLVSGQFMNIIQGASMVVNAAGPFEGVRFMIHGQVAATILTSNTTCANSEDGVIDVVTPEGVWNVTLAADQTTYSANGSVTFDHLSPGAYTLSISNGAEGCGVNEQTIIIDEPMPVTANQTHLVRATCIGNDGVLRYEVANTEWFAYVLMNGEGDIVREGTVEGNELVEEFLPGDQYELAIYTTCETITESIDLSPETNFNYLWTANTLSLQTGETLSIETQAGTGLSYTWNINGVQYNNASIEVIFDEPGVYNATLMVNNGMCTCSEEITITVGALDVNGTFEQSPVNVVQQGDIIWFSGDLAINKLQARVYDASGRLVMAKQLAPLTLANSQMMEMSGTSKGIYQIILVDEQHVYASHKIAMVK